MRPNFSPSTG